MTEDENKALQLYEKAVSCIKNQDFAGAEKYLSQSIEIKPSADSCHNMGTLRYIQGREDEAVRLFQTAVEIDPHYDESYANLLRIMYKNGDTKRAIEYSALAMSAAPEKKSHKIEFLSIISKLKFEFFSPDIKRLMTFCLEDGHLNYEKIGPAWVSIFKTDPKNIVLYSLSKAKDFAHFEKGFLSLDNYQSLLSRFFTLGLKNLVVPEMDFEKFLTYLRHLILKDFIKGNNTIFGGDYLDMVASLAIYCFYTEYIFDLDDDEKEMLNTLRERVDSLDDAGEKPYPLCLLACYEPIDRHSKAKIFMQQLETNQDLSTFTKCLLSEPLEEEEIKKDIISITSFDTETSKEVQEQYEENPYPRWRGMPLDHTETIENINRFLGRKDINILIAGSGTGQEVAFYAQSFPDSKILGVDLSKASLAHSIRKLKECNNKNIAHRQADILALDEVLDAQSYDLIASSGVLHHLKNPEEGLSILINLLKPDGIMHLAFYSEIAREPIARAHKIISKKGYGNDVESIKEFRRNARKLLGKKDYNRISQFHDYYYLSEYRDLLFHVMEHRYTIPQLADMLERHNLEFLAFRNDDDLYKKYDSAFPNDPERLNLNNWHKLEKKNPQIFQAMYQFWVRKK